MTGLGKTLEIRIPVRNVSRPGFHSECQVVVGARVVPIEIRDGEIWARFANVQCVEKPVVIELRTPEPQSPRELRGVPDDRKLGLAIAVI
jgi:hypothetical protein